ncbi:hypothetical protein ACP3S7_23220 [Phytobacter ursingii]
MAPGSSTPRRLVTLLRWLLAILMLVIGLAIGIPGIKLITLGGSVWFTAMGIVMLIAAILIGVVSENGIYGHSRFCNTDFDDKLACLNLSGV